jgi:formylmethanofuran dehydrogenase subunit E
MWLSEYINCELCNKKEWEKAIQEQNEHYLCRQCDGLYDDEELKEKITMID